MENTKFVETIKEILPVIVERIEAQPVFDEKEMENMAEMFRFWMQLPNDDERKTYWECLKKNVNDEKEIHISDSIYLMGRKTINKYNFAFCNDFSIRILLIILKKVMEKTEQDIIEIERKEYNHVKRI